MWLSASVCYSLALHVVLSACRAVSLGRLEAMMQPYIHQRRHEDCIYEEKRRIDILMDERVGSYWSSHDAVFGFTCGLSGMRQQTSHTDFSS
jgi:hypothetical protein